jgi:FMN-dependent oxidoreductase (nitrilotriacetate monooxygenase family)
MSERRDSQLRLGAYLPGLVGHHLAAWRHPEARADGGTDIAYYRELAAIAERGKFDAIFLADGLSVPDHPPQVLSRSGYVSLFEPLTLLAALAGSTTHIGLIGTVSTSYLPPFHLARKFASLDHISGGRAGWNLVTSANDQEARNFNHDTLAPHAERYARATEYMQVVKGLWNSWEDDAFLYDKESGRFFDPDKLHVLAHKGEHYAVRGPLNIARPPQGYPVLVQAGQSEPGKKIAAEHAEMVFTVQDNFEDARAFYADLKGRLAGEGRQPDELRIMPGIFPVVAQSRSEAQDIYAELQALIHPDIGVAQLSFFLDTDLSGYPLDGPLPAIKPSNGQTARVQLFLDLAQRENLSIRQLAQRIAGRGHWTVIGTATDVADQIEIWFHGHAADGFNVCPPYGPGGLSRFVDLVVPELQRRGLFRTEYQGRTLREHLGLKRPRHPQAR